MIPPDNREKKSFPASLLEWADAPIKMAASPPFSSLEIFDFQVMQDWETPLMRKMAEAVAKNGQTILEVGYGLGICTNFIQSYNPHLHIIIEANHKVAELARDSLADSISEGRVEVIDDFWENVINSPHLSLRSPRGFDGIVYDAFPLRSELLRKDQIPFFPAAARHLAEGGTFTYFSNETNCLSPEHEAAIRRHFPTDIVETEIVEVNVPLNCEYWTEGVILHVSIHRK